MIDPARLLDGDGDDFERALLRSAFDDGGSPAARARALSVFAGAGVNLVAATSAAKATAGTAPTSFAAAAVPKLTAGALLKWIGTGVVVGAVSAGGIHAVVGSRAGPPPTAQSPAPLRSPASATPPSVAHTNGSTATVEAPRVLANPPAPSAKPAEARAIEAAGNAAAPSVAAFPAEGSNPRLRDELLALERVRQALRRGDAAAALSGLAWYESHFPGGALSREGIVLAVEARLAAGDPEGARAVAAQALAADSTSPHAKRIEALILTRKNP